jgi:class 3 adenylate cyclase
MGASTYDLIRAEAIVRPLGTPTLKGKALPVEVWELLGLEGEAQRR